MSHRFGCRDDVTSTDQRQEYSMKLMSSVAALIAGIVLSAGAARATTRTSALACQALGAVSSSAYGWYNTSNSASATVSCGLSAEAGATPSFSVTMYDRNSSADVNCVVQGIDANGGVPYNVTIHSSGNSVGPQAVAGPAPSSSVTFFTAVCTIPPATASGQSFVTGFSVN
jgi:hypothetical protein